MVALRPLQVCATAKGHDYETIREAAFLDQEGKLFAFEVVPFRFLRVKIELDAPEQPDGVVEQFSQDPFVDWDRSLPSSSDVECRRRSDGVRSQ